MKHLLIAVAVFACCSTSLVAQWKFAGAGDMTGMNAGSDFALGVHDSILFRSDGLGVWRYEPNGLHPWVQVNTGIDFMQGNVTTFASIGRHFFAGMSYRGGPGAGYVTTNNGESWVLNGGSAVCSNGYLVFAVADGIYRSKDTGRSWEKVSTFIATAFGISGACVLASSSFGFWRSIDGGTNWDNATPPLGLSLSSFALFESQFFAGGSGVFRSLDSGLTWTKIGLSDRRVDALVAYKTYLFAGTDTGVFVSVDSGIHWRYVSEGLTTRPGYPLDARHLAILDTTIFVDVYTGSDSQDHTFGYLAKRPIPEMIDTARSAVNEAPLAFRETFAIYPNPFTNSATITYSLREPSTVQIAVFDVLGHVLARPVNEIQAVGTHDISFDASRLAPGIYWCCLSMNGQERILKMAITR
jgi:hypothetical protein